MVWRRLPTYFGYIRLRLLKPPPEQLQQLRETGWLPQVAFRTEPRVNKLEIKRFLEAVYNLPVLRVHTINYAGRQKRRMENKRKRIHVRLPDWKKAYVTFKPRQGPGQPQGGGDGNGQRDREQSARAVDEA